MTRTNRWPTASDPPPPDRQACEDADEAIADCLYDSGEPTPICYPDYDSPESAELYDCCAEYGMDTCDDLYFFEGCTLLEDDIATCVFDWEGSSGDPYGTCVGTVLNSALECCDYSYSYSYCDTAYSIGYD